MGRLVEPVPTYDSQDCGVPPGKAQLQVRDKNGRDIGGRLDYNSLEEALLDAATQLLKANGDLVVINFKAPDESFLDCWCLEHKAKLPRQKPMFQWLSDWWRGKK